MPVGGEHHRGPRWIPPPLREKASSYCMKSPDVPMNEHIQWILNWLENKLDWQLEQRL